MAVKKEVVSTENAPKAIRSKDQPTLQGTIEQQTRLVMDNLGAVLTAAGMTFDNGVMATCFLKDLNDFPKFNETYATYFKDNMPPGCATVQVARIPRDVLVEVAFIAVK